MGGGAMGAATAWQLARRGHDVALLERYEPGHRNGASHGASRNFNVAYADPTYVDLLVEALPLWRELESESGTPLLDLVGVANHGHGAHFDDVDAALAAAGVPVYRRFRDSQDDAAESVLPIAESPVIGPGWTLHRA